MILSLKGQCSSPSKAVGFCVFSLSRMTSLPLSHYSSSTSNTTATLLCRSYVGFKVGGNFKTHRVKIFKLGTIFKTTIKTAPRSLLQLFSVLLSFFDPLGQPKVTAGRDHCFRTCCPSVPTFQIFKTINNRKQCSLPA